MKNKKVKADELAKAIVDGLFKNGKKAVYFGEWFNSTKGEVEAWHGASVVVDGTETLLLIRHMGGWGNAVFYSFWGTRDQTLKESERERVRFANELAVELGDYLYSNDFETDDSNECVAWLEY